MGLIYGVTAEVDLSFEPYRFADKLGPRDIIGSGGLKMGWFERWSRRQDALARGADADLVRDNRKRYRLAFLLLGFAILLSLLVSKVDLGKQLRLVTSVVAAGSGVAGLFLLMWARQEQVWLHKPDPEVPPKIFK